MPQSFKNLNGRKVRRTKSQRKRNQAKLLPHLLERLETKKQVNNHIIFIFLENDFEIQKN